MAQTNSVPREPSMEEILASIRRIIEDSDAARPLNDASEAHPALRSSQADVADIDAFRATARESFAQAEEPEARSEPQEQSEPAETPHGQHFTEELRPGLTAFAAPEPVVPETAPAQAQAEAEQSGFGSYSEYGETQSSREDPLLGFEDMLDEALNRTTEVPEQDPAPVPSIISDKTGRQVAAAFGELSEAFAATRQKSFDEMAEAMIRPMLSDWLDNNLPTLVERLVREEIERIARGPAR